MGVAACLTVTVSFRIYDPDLWQHLEVGRYLWRTGHIPRTEIWSWPSYGAPSVLPSWGFRALLWPFFAAGGVWGLYVWRWLTSIGTGAILWVTARRMGARGVLPVVMLVLAGLIWRQRSMARPETLAMILLALELLILESRRHGGRDRSPWLVLVLWLWVQAHVSFVFGFVVLAIYLADDLLRRRAGAASRPAPLAIVLVTAAAVAFVNPFFTGLMRQPFEFFLERRHDVLLQLIDELKPVDWRMNLRNGLPLLAVAWPALALIRAARGHADFAELASCALFTWLGLTSQRFLGFYSWIAALFVARDLETSWRAAGRAPAPLGFRSALVTSAIMVAMCVPEWTRPEPPLGIGFDLRGFPVVACDFMATHGVRGRGFNYFFHGGYLLWRFDAERDRLPFLNIHPESGTPQVREGYLAAFGNPEGWRALDREFSFAWVLLRRQQAPGDHILDSLDGDSTFVPVFLDDAAALYVRRQGSMAAVADSFGYRLLPGGRGRLEALGKACERDAAIRAATRRELERALAGSPRHGLAASLLANVAMIEERYADARRLLLESQAVAPEIPMVRERLAMIAARDSSAEPGAAASPKR